MEHLEKDAMTVGISPMDFDSMTPKQVIAAVEGYDRRLRQQAVIADRFIDKMIRGMAFSNPKLISFTELFPGWQEEKVPESPARTPEERLRLSIARLDAWCDKFED